VVSDSEIKIIQVPVSNTLIAPVLDTRIISVALQGIPGTSGGLLIEEVPTPIPDGSTTAFTLTHQPLLVVLYLNGLARVRSAHTENLQGTGNTNKEFSLISPAG
jgi:hypothetical protein